MNETLLALETKDLGNISGIGPLGNPGADPNSLFEQLVSKTIGFLTIIAILWFILQIIFASYSWITSGSDPKAVSAAQQKISQAIVGLIVVFAALVIVGAIGYLLGVDALNIAKALNSLRLGGE